MVAVEVEGSLERSPSRTTFAPKCGTSRLAYVQHWATADAWQNRFAIFTFIVTILRVQSCLYRPAKKNHRHMVYMYICTSSYYSKHTQEGSPQCTTEFVHPTRYTGLSSAGKCRSRAPSMRSGSASHPCPCVLRDQMHVGRLCRRLLPRSHM